MRTLAELLDAPDPAWPLVQDWMADAANPVEVLPPDPARRGESLLAAQVSLKSVLGAVIYETGGLRVDHGWVRVLGSGHPRLTRTLASWNLQCGVMRPGEPRSSVEKANTAWKS